jgi:selenocysteine lyase/cysteine desulfurase
MLPWRRHGVRLLPFTHSADELLEAAERMLSAGGVDLLAVTGASNVTGEVWPIAGLAAIAHCHGAEILVDAAQLAPHRRIDMRGLGIDYLALSGHKLYAPFGAGALVARPERLRNGKPLLEGGGAIEFVTLDDVTWAGVPERFEAGSPNVLGAVALAAACEALLAIGMDEVAKREHALAERLWQGLARVPGLDLLRLWPGDADRLGVATFNLRGLRHSLVAAALSAEHAIGVRNGCFCAHPLMTRLLGVSDSEAARIRGEVARGDRSRVPGAVRASIGLGTRLGDLDTLAEALDRLARRGPARRYVYDAVRDEHRPAAARRAPRPVAVLEPAAV